MGESVEEFVIESATDWERGELTAEIEDFLTRKAQLASQPEASQPRGSPARQGTQSAVGRYWPAGVAEQVKCVRERESLCMSESFLTRMTCLVRTKKSVEQ